jgi:hypothetical protein
LESCSTSDQTPSSPPTPALVLGLLPPAATMLLLLPGLLLLLRLLPPWWLLLVRPIRVWRHRVLLLLLLGRRRLCIRAMVRLLPVLPRPVLLPVLLLLLRRPCRRCMPVPRVLRLTVPRRRCCCTCTCWRRPIGHIRRCLGTRGRCSRVGRLHRVRRVGRARLARVHRRAPLVAARLSKVHVAHVLARLCCCCCCLGVLLSAAAPVQLLL